MKIASNTKVTIHYKASTEDGNVVENTFGDKPFSYIHGGNQILPGLEEALNGVENNTQFKVKIPADKAWGPRDENLIETVPREALAHVEDLAAGQRFQLPEDDGTVQIISILDVNNETVTVDANHPLAGKDLIYEIEVLSVEAVA